MPGRVSFVVKVETSGEGGAKTVIGNQVTAVISRGKALSSTYGFGIDKMVRSRIAGMKVRVLNPNVMKKIAGKEVQFAEVIKSDTKISPDSKPLDPPFFCPLAWLEFLPFQLV